jgi:hypothetical protein
VFIILNFYAPSWFHLKANPKLHDAARNFFYMVKLTSVLRSQERAVIHKVMLNNSFSAHHESVLLSMVTDSRVKIRKIALRRIIMIRKICKGKNAVRKFRRPTNLNFKCNNYYEMIDWTNQKDAITEPLLTMQFTNKQILNAINTGKCLDFGVSSKIPNNTQSVERMVKLVTNASSKYVGYQNRHHFILNSLKARQLNEDSNLCL